MTQDEITIEEIIKLDSERTQGVWVRGQTATNPRNHLFASYPIIYSEKKGDSSDICRMTYDTAIADAVFIAAAPRIAAKAIELDKENKHLADFKRQALAILQEFDAQNPKVLVNKDVRCKDITNNEQSIQTTHICILPDEQNIQTCCEGCEYELDALIEYTIKGFKDKNWYSLINHIKNNYPEQLRKYMGKNPNITESMSDEIDAAEKEPIEFVVGEFYDWIDIWESSDSGRHEQPRIGKFIAKNNANELVFDIEGYGFSVLDAGNPTLKKHILAPKEHEVDCYINIYYTNNDDHYLGHLHKTRQHADKDADEDRIACLHFKRTFTEGEGLE